jgi:hypothetical protein
LRIERSQEWDTGMDAISRLHLDVCPTLKRAAPHHECTL